MFKNKRVRTFLSIMVVAIIILFVFAVTTQQQKENPDKQSVDIYFLNIMAQKLEAESRYIQKSSNEEMIQSIIEQIYRGPINKNLSKVVPENVRFLEGSIVNNEGLLKLSFSPEYNELSPDEELFLRSSLVWSLTELDTVKYVKILVNGEELLRPNGKPMDSLNRENVVIDSEISPGISDTQRFTLYFGDENLQGLLRENRTAEVVKLNPDQSTEKYVLEQLILGPLQPERYPTIPPETKVREVNTDMNICYVNLSSEFITKYTGTLEQQAITIYSIVNSLTELSSIKKVQFLIESEKPDTFKGGFDLSKPIERDEGLILK